MHAYNDPEIVVLIFRSYNDKKVDLKTISKERRRLRVQGFNNKVRTELIEREKIKEAREKIDCFQIRLRKGSKENVSFI